MARRVFMTMSTPIPFERAVSEHGARVLRVCRAVLGCSPDADDAYSETFLAALQNWPELATGTNIEAWLVRVAQRKSIDVLRGRARAVPTDVVPDRGSPIGNPGASDAELWAAVGALPERQRLAIAYHFLGGLPHAETAEVIGGTAESVRRASADGVKTLRKSYRTPPPHDQGASR